MEHWWNDDWQGKAEVKPNPRGFVYHKSLRMNVMKGHVLFGAVWGRVVKRSVTKQTIQEPVTLLTKQY
jgi:hypothetical protein